jgi:hypothetical protein
MSAHAGVTNWVPPPHIIFPPSLNQMSSASHLPAATGTLDRDRVLVSNPRKRSVEDAGIDDFDNVDSDFEDEDDDADVLALDQGHEAILEIDGEEVWYLSIRLQPWTHVSLRLWTTYLANRSQKHGRGRRTARGPCVCLAPKDLHSEGDSAMGRQISLSLNRRPQLRQRHPRRQRGRARYVSK